MRTFALAVFARGATFLGENFHGSSDSTFVAPRAIFPCPCAMRIGGRMSGRSDPDSPPDTSGDALDDLATDVYHASEVRARSDAAVPEFCQERHP